MKSIWKHRNCSVNSISDSQWPSASAMPSVSTEQCPADLDPNTAMDESEQSSVTSAIAELLKDISFSVLQSVVETLKSLGVTSPEDFQYVQEADLLPVLQPIQARKLVSAWSQMSSSCYTSKQFMLSIDQKITTQHISTFITAICMMFGSYYCFNIHYPLELGSTLEFMQRCFFSINPEKGTKVKQEKTKNSSQ